MSKSAFFYTGLFISMLFAFTCHGQVKPEDAILGKWITIEGTLMIDVYKDKNDFKARITWFRNHDDTNSPMEKRLDKRNPDKSLRGKKILGMDVLKKLTYNACTNRWEHGIIYDATSGREWDSAAWVSNKGLLKVRGFWQFEFMGKTLTFKRAV